MTRTLLGLGLVALVAVPSASATVLHTNWVETQPYSGARGSLTVSVRKIEVTRTAWTAWVGLSNQSSVRVRITQEPVHGAGNLPLVFFAGPGIWWQTYEKGTSWWPGSGTSVTHSARAGRVAPNYPSALAPRARWSGVFSGSLERVPASRLLRIGLGSFEPSGGRASVVSTTHQFRLPKR